MANGLTDKWSRGVFVSWRTLFHLIGAVSFSYGVFYDFAYVYPPEDHPAYTAIPTFGAKFRDLTMFGAIFQALYFTLCVLNDFIGTNENYPKRPSALRKFKDYIFATFAFPLGTFVPFLFWPHFILNRETIYPESFESFSPTWLNHIMHTNVAIFVLIDIFWTFRQYPCRKFGLMGLITFSICHVIWIIIINYKTGKWFYPVFYLLSTHERIQMILFYSVLGNGFYLFGEAINDHIWANELKSSKRDKKRK